MPQWLPLQKGEVLPLFVQRPKPASCVTTGIRRWRALHRFQRTVIIALACGLLIFGFYAQVYSLSSQVEDVYHRQAFTTKRYRTENNASGNVRSGVITFPEPNQRQQAIRDAFKHAWRGYKKFAWGYDHLKPISKGYSEWMQCGLTIIDSLDTMLIMNLEEEFAEAKEWVINSLSFEKDNYVNLFETTIRILGGLLTAFHITKDDVFKLKAEDIGLRLMGALEKTTVPYSDVNLKTKQAKQPAWGGESSLSEVTSIQLEFRDLSRLTGNQSFETKSFQVSEHIHKIGCKNHDGLCGMFLNPATGTFRDGTTITLGARADSFYEYLLKQWLQTGKTIDWLRTDYAESVDAMKKHLWRSSEPNKFWFVGELLSGNSFSPKMDHLVCFLAGTLALGTENGMPEWHLEMAKNLSRTCYEMYKTPTGLAPEIAYFNQLPGTNKDDVIIKPLDAHSLLRPEAFEAWFYMYRITKDKMYQEWGWEAFLAIERYARVENGYSSVNNCKKIPVTYRDMMESFFLSESLKYLYLLLSDDQTIFPLNEYVFNTEGHPLPVYNY
ncbi:unnamed protein product [Bursaphelenchus xylophilus]|uniref:alpha-1,2-Mannosidase n=1 Tax=Bursaphelenchus xylophilus TaxID=6326 RepID=A0A1I7SDA4_BURXY|nr:unnamed protein product [Bursaphelenchus xylophilus]CAG9130560.1 unnamed protein product [Bursaphelenchus xylophilus]